MAYAAFAVRDFDGASILPRRVMMLDALCVDGPCRRQGIAHAMLEELCRRGRALGCTDLQLACDSRNTSALAFYEAQGMQRKLIQFKSSDTKNQGASCALKSPRRVRRPQAANQ